MVLKIFEIIIEYSPDFKQGIKQPLIHILQVPYHSEYPTTKSYKVRYKAPFLAMIGKILNIHGAFLKSVYLVECIHGAPVVRATWNNQRILVD